MTSEESKLFSRIAAFVFDEGSPDMTYADRLAKDNGWGIFYALRVIEEYRRFAFLIVTAGHVAVPSDQVDQAWHQHLLYTRSWSSFCRDVARRPIHHDPTKGGVAEKERFAAEYERTLQSYQKFFGEPPDDIWPNTGVRFGRDLTYRRVNLKQSIVISRSWLQPFGVAVAVLLGTALLTWID